MGSALEEVVDLGNNKLVLLVSSRRLRVWPLVLLDSPTLGWSESNRTIYKHPVSTGTVMRSWPSFSAAALKHPTVIPYPVEFNGHEYLCLIDSTSMGWEEKQVDSRRKPVPFVVWVNATVQEQKGTSLGWQMSLLFWEKHYVKLRGKTQEIA